MKNAERIQEPVVQRTVVFKFQRTAGVGNPFDGILDAVCPVIHGIDTPLIARMRMRGMQDTVHDRVSHVHIGGGHINLRPQNPCAVREFPGSHAFEQIEVFRRRAFPVRTDFPGFGQGAAVFMYLPRGRIINIGLSGFDKL